MFIVGKSFFSETLSKYNRKNRFKHGYNEDLEEEGACQILDEKNFLSQEYKFCQFNVIGRIFPSQGKFMLKEEISKCRKEIPATGRCKKEFLVKK